jgi:hypothetical protein
VLAGLVCAALLALPAATNAAAGPRFTAIPKRVVAGSQVKVAIALAPKNPVRCALAVRYADGKRQAGLPVLPAFTTASWTWQVPDTTAAGIARVTVSCGRLGRATRTMLIVGSLIPPKIEVVSSGFSIRTRPIGTNVSWGLVLKNTSPNADALKVYLLLNFVLADNRALGTQTTDIDTIGAGSLFYVGGELTFPEAAPIVRLEPVIQVGAHQRKLAFFPTISTIVVERDLFDPGWVGAVSGQLVNDDPPWIFDHATVYAVVFDAAGNILGGGSGFAFGRLPPGTRQVFKASSGFDPIPLDKAAYALVSTEPTYQLPPA